MYIFVEIVKIWCLNSAQLQHFHSYVPSTTFVDFLTSAFKLHPILQPSFISMPKHAFFFHPRRSSLRQISCKPYVFLENPCALVYTFAQPYEPLTFNLLRFFFSEYFVVFLHYECTWISSIIFITCTQ
jgi:hypothetical protein